MANSAALFVSIMVALMSLVNAKPFLLLSSKESEQSTPMPVLTSCRPGQFIKRDCKFYIDCYKGRWRRNFCPHDKFWNQNAKKCDDIHNVPECYQLILQIRTNSAGSHPSSTTVASKPFTTAFTTTTTSTTTTEMPPQVSTNDNYKDEDGTDVDEDVEENGNSDFGDEFYKRETNFEKKNKKDVMNLDVIRYRPNISDDDYEDYDENGDQDDDDKNAESDKAATTVNKPDRSGDVNAQPKLSPDPNIKSGNDIVEEKIMTDEDYKVKNSYYDSDLSSQENKTDDGGSVQLKTSGKICIVRGKELICHNQVDAQMTASSHTEAKSTSTVTPSISEENFHSEIELSPSSQIKEPKHKLRPLSDRNNNNRIDRTVWSLKIEIKVDESVERLVRLIAYYVGLTIQMWKSK